MTRPHSILAFERLYLGSIAVSAIQAGLFWPQFRASMAAMPQVQNNATVASIMGGVMGMLLIAILLFSLLFWYLVARARSIAGKWCVVVTEAIGAVVAVPALLRLARNGTDNPTSLALGLLATVLAIAAAAMLFRADAGTWLYADEDVAEKPSV